jgi:hypothetical protein
MVAKSIFCFLHFLIFEFTPIDYFLLNDKKNKSKIYNLLHFVLVFDFTFIYLLRDIHIEIGGNFERRKTQSKRVRRGFSLYTVFSHI